MEYIEHVSYPGFGWIDPIQDQDCPLVAEETAAAFIEYCESLRQQLAAALAACEAKDARFKQIVRMANHLDVLSIAMQAHDAIAIKPDASALKARDEALIERCAEVCEEHQGSAETCAAAIRELKSQL